MHPFIQFDMMLVGTVVVVVVQAACHEVNYERKGFPKRASSLSLIRFTLKHSQPFIYCQVMHINPFVILHVPSSSANAGYFYSFAHYSI
jgi:hypothetical protein